MKTKPIFISFGYSRHGIAFFLQCLKALLKEREMIDSLGSGNEKEFSDTQYDQYELQRQWKCNDELPIDKAHFLIPQNLRKWQKSYPSRWQDTRKRLVDEVIRVEPQNSSLIKAIKGLCANKDIPSYNNTKIIFKNNGADIAGLWHAINEYPVKYQLEWLEDLKPQINFPKIIIKQLPIDDMEDVVGIRHALTKYFAKYGLEGQKLLINLYGTTTEIQIAWYYLAWHDKAMEHARLLKIRDSKTKKNRFGDITVEEVRKDLLKSPTIETSDITIPKKTLLYKKVEHLQFYIKERNFFPIFLLGERGTGKSAQIETIVGKDKSEVVNCASFSGSDYNIARSELFGCEKGIHSYAKVAIKGAFERASEENPLFLDEIHHLDPRVQADLLRTLQTDEDGYFRFKKVGGSKEIKNRFQLICASNKEWEELVGNGEYAILPDLLDRISQRVIRLPSLAEEREHLKDEFPSVIRNYWDKIWQKMKFKIPNPYNHDKELRHWLNVSPLKGNFRDLEKAAIQYNDRLRMNESIRDEITPLEHLKRQARYSTNLTLPGKNNKGEVNLEELTDFVCGKSFSDFDSFNEARKFFIQKYSQWIFDQNNGSIKRSAKAMGVCRVTFSKWLKG